MKIRVTDIPNEGCSTELELDRQSVNKRLLGESVAAGHKHPPVSDTQFPANPRATLNVSLEDKTTVRLLGGVEGDLLSPCARCAEEAKTHLDLRIDMILKPETQRGEDESEDVNFGYYSDELVDCDAVVEEALMLAVPYVVLCSESCRGLCPVCGTNLNQNSCQCPSSAELNSPFRVLKEMKILQ